MTQPAVLALKKIAAVHGLNDPARRQLVSLCEARTIEQGTVLFNEGEKHDLLYFVLSGTVHLDMVTANCGRQTVLSVGGGDLLAWSALIGDGTMTATAVAAERTDVVAIIAAALQQRMDEDSALGYEVMRVVAHALSRRLVATRLQLLDLYH